MIDYRAVLEYLRPGVEYHWKGGQRGVDDSVESIGEWRDGELVIDEAGNRVWIDSETTKPTEQEILNAWEFLSLRETVDQSRRNLLANTVAAGFENGENVYSMTSESLENWQKLATTLSVARLAAGDGGADPDVEIFTAAGESVFLKRSETIELLAAIGDRARLVQTRDLKWTAAIAAATTVDELEAIAEAIETVE